MTARFLNTDFLKKLELLSLIAKRILPGQVKGERLSSKKGTSVEFADYRSYESGDDFRYIDWNIYSRLERLVLKLFREEEDLTIHILVDASDSMDFGSPSKLDYALRLAAALGYLGLANLDRVGLGYFSTDLRERLAPRRGKKQVFHLFNFLERIRPQGRTDINRSLRTYGMQVFRPGALIVISDFLDEHGYKEGLEFLQYKKFTLFLIQIVSDEEISPPFKGDLKLVDGETDQIMEISLNEETLSEYNLILEDFFLRLQRFCLEKGIEYIRASTSIPLENLVLRYLKEGGFLK